MTKSIARRKHSSPYEAISIKRIGQLVNICVDKDAPSRPYSSRPWMIEVEAVVCQLLASSDDEALLWNDLVGRIYVKDPKINPDLKIFSIVKVQAKFDGDWDCELQNFFASEV